MFTFILIAACVVNVLNVNGQTCEPGWHRFQNKCFWKSDLAATRDENEKKCRSMNAELVTVHSNEENNFLRTFATFNHFYHLGATRVNLAKNQFKWSDGTSVGYTAWGWCEPNELWYPNSYCTVVFVGRRVQWFDEDCRRRRFQLCQRSVNQLPNGNQALNGLQQELNEIKKLQSLTLDAIRGLTKTVQYNFSVITDRISDIEMANVTDNNQNWTSDLKDMLLGLENRLLNVVNITQKSESDLRLEQIHNSTKNIESNLENLKETDHLKKIEEFHKNSVESVKSLIYELLAKKSLDKEDGEMKKLHDRLTTIIETLTAEREEWRKKENTSFEILAKLLKKMMDKDASEEEARRQIDYYLKAKKLLN